MRTLLSDCELIVFAMLWMIFMPCLTWSSSATYTVGGERENVLCELCGKGLLHQPLRFGFEVLVVWVVRVGSFKKKLFRQHLGVVADGHCFRFGVEMADVCHFGATSDYPYRAILCCLSAQLLSLRVGVHIRAQ